MPMLLCLPYGEAVIHEQKSAYRPRVQNESSGAEESQPHLVVARHGCSDSRECDWTVS
jgi:hypothetical protein